VKRDRSDESIWWEPKKILELDCGGETFIAMDPYAIECVHYGRDQDYVTVVFASGKSCQITLSETLFPRKYTWRLSVNGTEPNNSCAGLTFVEYCFRHVRPSRVPELGHLGI